MTQVSLTAEQLAELRKQLECSLDTLGGDIATEREEVRGSTEVLRGAVQDRSEESIAGSMAAVDRALLKQFESERRQVQAALARLRDGSYGECVHCGEPIAYARLCVAPAAGRCMRCQELAEAD
jgi:RNA polymerase-binding transcription factor DksA